MEPARSKYQEGEKKLTFEDLGLEAEYKHEYHNDLFGVMKLENEQLTEFMAKFNL